MKNNYASKILSLLKKLSVAYPYQPLLSHLALALEEYPSYGQVENKEVVFQLNKYMTERELDFTIPRIASESEVDRIIREGMDLDTILSPSEDEEEDF